MDIVTDICSSRAGSGPNVGTIKAGTRLSLQVGPEEITGIVDVVMADKSYFWIWADGGMGRRMIDIRDVLAVRPATQSTTAEFS